jgi:regulator of sirC expression with transglutaminase-like and TPR domain
MDASFTAAEARTALDAAGQLPDAELDLAAVALQFARIDAPEADSVAAAAHLSDLAREAVTMAMTDPEADAGDAVRRASVLGALLHDHFGYAGDQDTYDDPANANLIRVTERRRGLPVALGLLWLHAAEAAGWDAHGLDFPGHFLLGISGARGMVVVDPFHGGLVLEAPALRALLKQFEGEQAELRPGLLATIGKRPVLLRLQNNLKLRRLRAGDMLGALACTEDILRLAPREAQMWRDAAIMNQRLDRIGAALLCLEHFLALTPEGEAAERARALAVELRQRLN